MVSTSREDAHKIMLRACDRVYKQAFTDRFNRAKVFQTNTSFPFFAEGRLASTTKHVSRLNTSSTDFLSTFPPELSFSQFCTDEETLAIMEGCSDYWVLCDNKEQMDNFLQLMDVDEVESLPIVKLQISRFYRHSYIYIMKAYMGSMSERGSPTNGYMHEGHHPEEFLFKVKKLFSVCIQISNTACKYCGMLGHDSYSCIQGFALVRHLEN